LLRRAERSKERAKAAVWVCETKVWVRRVWNRRRISDLHPNPDLALSLQKVIKYLRTKCFEQGKLDITKSFLNDF